MLVTLPYVVEAEKKMWHLSFASYFPLFFHKLITILEIDCHQRQSKQNKGGNCSFFFLLLFDCNVCTSLILIARPSSTS